MSNLKQEEVFDDYGVYLNFNNWDPDEKDRSRILNQFQSHYDSAKELCGDTSEEAEDARVLYKKILSGTLMENKKEIQDFFADLYLAVNGQLRKYYMDIDLIELIQLTVM